MKNLNLQHPIMQSFGVNYMPEPIIDEASSTVTYYGYAPMGTDESEAGWMIMRKTKTGNVTKCEYAGGRMDYEFKWSDRTNYSYAR